jgi:hypothetical protein
VALDLFAPGAYARAAGGNQEIPDFQKQAVSWIAWSLNADNGGQGGIAVWEKAIDKWNAAGIGNFPWMHVRKMEDLQRLISVGQGKNSPAIGCNIEDVVGDKLDLKDVGQILTSVWGKPVHLATLPWVQNGQGWANLSFAVAALELFPDEQGIWPGNVYSQKIADDCVAHAFQEGLTKVTTMLKTKGYSPTDYGESFTVCHSLYTSDDIPPTQAGWAAWKPVTPCTRLVKENDVPLTPTEKKSFRDQLRRYCLVAQKYDHLWHYTQQRPYTGLGSPASDTHYNDCSSYIAIAFYKAGRNSGVRVDDPLGYHYTGWGNTGSCYAEMKKYPAPKDKYRVGDVALYLGAGGFGDHMVVCIQAGDGQSSVWSSFGSEAGPVELKLHYRSDLTGVYRPEDLR